LLVSSSTIAAQDRATEEEIVALSTVLLNHRRAHSAEENIAFEPLIDSILNTR